jgi:hypothetical protein
MLLMCFLLPAYFCACMTLACWRAGNGDDASSRDLATARKENRDLATARKEKPRGKNVWVHNFVFLSELEQLQELF